MSYHSHTAGCLNNQQKKSSLVLHHKCHCTNHLECKLLCKLNRLINQVLKMFVTVQNALNSAYQALDDKGKGIIMKHKKKLGEKKTNWCPPRTLQSHFVPPVSVVRSLSNLWSSASNKSLSRSISAIVNCCSLHTYTVIIDGETHTETRIKEPNARADQRKTILAYLFKSAPPRSLHIHGFWSWATLPWPCSNQTPPQRN